MVGKATKCVDCGRLGESCVFPYHCGCIRIKKLMEEAREKLLNNKEDDDCFPIPYCIDEKK